MNFKRFKKQVLYGAIVMVGVLLFPGDIRAATFSLNPEFISMKPEQEFVVKVYVDTEGESDNAFSGDIVFPEYLELTSISLEDSIISAWVTSPYESGNSVTFLGITPGGFGGLIDSFTGEMGPGILFSMRFKSLEEGVGKIEFVEGKVIRNDGMATPENLTLNNSMVTISASAEGSPSDPDEVDVFPPEQFSVKITSHKSVFGGKYFLAFDTIDKDSKVESYYVREGRKNWIKAESPYLLSDQTLRSKIWVRAVDPSGNVRTEHLRATVRPTFSIFFVLIPLMLVILYVSNRKKIKNNEKTTLKN